MTKRLPFARVELDSIGSMVLRCGQGGHVFWDSDKGYLQRAADLINAAHEARVKEECEKVRFETIRLCADKADRMGSEEIRNAIMFETGRQ